jgi:hypothetical protein
MKIIDSFQNNARRGLFALGSNERTIFGPRKEKIRTSLLYTMKYKLHKQKNWSYGYMVSWYGHQNYFVTQMMTQVAHVQCFMCE